MARLRMCSQWLLFVLPVFVLGCSSSDEQNAADLTIPVVVEKVKRGPIAAFVAATGTLRPEREENVIAEVEGTLRLARNNGIVVAAGSPIQAGQLLAEIDNQEYLLGVRVESQKLAMENAVRELAKQEALYTEGGVTEKELELARRTALDARLNYETALIKAEKLRLTAPISGYLANLQTSADGIRIPARFRLCTIVDYRTVSLQVKLPNTDFGRIEVGQEVNISNYALTNAVFQGVVSAIDPTIDPQTRTFTVDIEVANDKLILKPGMFVKADIIVDSRKEAIVIAKTSLQTRDNKPVVFVVAGASAEMREVRTGLETREEIEIVEGLNADEKLVVKGHETLRDKSKVRVTE